MAASPSSTTSRSEASANADRHLDRLATAERVDAGLAIVPEDRQRAGLVTTMSVAHNMTLSSLTRFARAGWLSPAAERDAAGRVGRDVRLKYPSLFSPVTALSGGNQQKVIIARALLSEPRVLLMDEPSRGVDVAARAEIIQCMQRLAADGLGVIFTSSDVDELRAAATRVLVMARGRITGELDPAAATAEALAARASAAAAPRESALDADGAAAHRDAHCAAAAPGAVAPSAEPPSAAPHDAGRHARGTHAAEPHGAGAPVTSSHAVASSRPGSVPRA